MKKTGTTYLGGALRRIDTSKAMPRMSQRVILEGKSADSSGPTSSRNKKTGKSKLGKSEKMLNSDIHQEDKMFYKPVQLKDYENMIEISSAESNLGSTITQEISPDKLEKIKKLQEEKDIDA